MKGSARSIEMVKRYLVGEFGLVFRVPTVHLLVSILRVVCIQVGYRSAAQAELTDINIKFEDDLPQPNILTINNDVIDFIVVVVPKMRR